jgi:hypothetical protein
LDFVKRNWPYFFTLLFSVAWLSYNYFSLLVPVDPGDGILHFFYSEASWEQPILFLNLWNKPLFTLLSSSFAQFGLGGMIFFNILVFIFTVIFAWKILQYFNVNRYFALSFPLFLLLTQDYSNTILGGNTEPLFSMILVIATWFWVKEKFLFFAFLIGLLLFSRSEGQLTVLLAFSLLMYVKQWKAVLFLALPFLVFAVIGWFVFDDFLWYFNRSPYQMNNAIYGVGTYDHYLLSYKNFIGNHGLFLFILALPATIIHFVRKEFTYQTCGMTYLAYGTFLGVIAAHSYFWGSGQNGSLGLTRIATLGLPSFLICQFYFFQKTPWKWPVVSRYFALGLFAILYSYLAFTPYLNKKIKPLEQNVKTVFEKNKDLLKGQKVETSHPYFALLLNENYLKDHSNVRLLTTDIMKEGFHSSSKTSFVLWDNHFGPLESKVPIEYLLNSPKFKLISAENGVYLFGTNSWGE